MVPTPSGRPEGDGRLPDFLIIGAAKSGTTTLHHYLEQHPRVFMSENKEPCFFDDAVAWRHGVDWYRSLFAEARPGQLCGEASTNYTRYPQVSNVPERMANLIPDVKLIYVMRHPVERAYSHYLHRYQKELHQDEPIRESFEEFVEHDPMCLDSSDYELQLSRYFPHFPRSSFLFLTIEELRDTRRIVDKVLRFLGLDPAEMAEFDDSSMNRASDFQETVVRGQITEPLRRIPAVRAFAYALPQGFRDGVYDVLRRTPYGKGVSRGFEPEPMRDETREALLRRYRRSNAFIRDELGVDTTGWDE